MGIRRPMLVTTDPKVELSATGRGYTRSLVHTIMFCDVHLLGSNQYEEIPGEKQPSNPSLHSPNNN